MAIDWNDVEIVSLAQAKLHARITGNLEDDQLRLYLRQAHGLVLDYVVRPTDQAHIDELQTWDDESAPAAVQAAIMRQFAELARFRGDDEDVSKVDGLDLSPRIKQLLRMYRDPALA